MSVTGTEAHTNNRDSWAAVESAPMFAGISPEDFRRISAAARLKRFACGETLYLEGDTIKQVYLLISGCAKVTQLGPKAVEVILRLGTPGDILGAASLFSTGMHCTTAQAIRGCGTLVWDAGIFKTMVEGLPILHKNMIRLTCGLLRELEERFRELATEPVAPRLARQLVRLQQQLGSGKEAVPGICISRESLAQMTGTTIYTVSRLLSAWESHGFVNSRRNSVMISDLRLLRKVFEENWEVGRCAPAAEGRGPQAVSTLP